MPGHVKAGKAGEPDPDPAPFLVISMEMKREDMLKPYDPKKSYWVPNGKGGFCEGLLMEDDGTKAVVMCGHEVRIQ
jgi:myosin heavy chain 6/7